MANLHTWEITLGILALVILVDLAIAIARRNSETKMSEAAGWTIFYVAAAIFFGTQIDNFVDSPTARGEFFAGWLTEYALSVDNIFVFVIILSKLKVAKEKQQLVLLYGILIAILMRGIFILAGAALVSRFTSIFFLFGAFLIYTAVKLVKESEAEEADHIEHGRVVTFLRKRGASNFTIALVAVGTTDLLFALDSIPAIFGITKDPYIVATANIFALMGLRQLYFLLQGLMSRLIHLSRGLSIILAFIGVKMILEAAHGLGLKTPEIGIELSLGVIILTLTITTITSLVATRKNS
ncbi:MAG: hypothetical protein RLZ57_499 [Actinomycetota bacterium]|jgi:tellurite resistance protein TerC